MRDGETKKASYIAEMLKALAAAIIVTLLLVLLSAFLIKIFNIPTEHIGIINQVIKGAAIFVSAMLCFKLPDCGYIRGAALGIVYILTAYVVFSLFNGSFAAGISLLNDVTLGAVTGLISGIVAVNVGKKR